MAAWDLLVGAVTRSPRASLAAGAALVLACGLAAPGVAFTSDTTEVLPAVSPEVKAWLELSRRFDAFNSLIVGLEEPAGPLENLGNVKRVTDRLASLKASGVLSVSSVTNIDSIREAADGSLETELLVPRLPADRAALDALSKRIAADVQVSGVLISRDQQGYLVLVRADPRKDTAELARLVQRVVEEERGPLTAAWYGAPFFSAVITRSVYAQLTWLAPAFILSLIGVLAFTVRRWRTIALVLGCDVLVLVVWLGLVRVFGVVLSFTSLTTLLLLVAAASLTYAGALDARSQPSSSPLPASHLHALAAFGLAALSLKLLPFGFLAAFGVAAALGALAIALVGLLVFAPLAKRVAVPLLAAPGPTPWRPLTVGLAVLVTLVGSLLASRAAFRMTPQETFSEHDEVGRSLSFFDRRFGGPDFIQVDYRGDLRDPAVAARLLRLTDLLEGSRAFSDVRTVAQVLGFLSHGFGGVHRVPPTRESLGNLWFFLEGRPDVRNIASDQRDEAMAVLRIPSRPRPVTELVAVIDAAVEASREPPTVPSTRRRLLALARAFSAPLEPARVDEVLGAALSEADKSAIDAQVRARLQQFLASPDSPYQPTAEEWRSLETALMGYDLRARVTEAARGFRGLNGDAAMAGQLADTVLSHEKDLRLTAHAALLTERLWSGPVPEACRIRAQGVIADLLDPPPPDGAVQVEVSGLPVIAARISTDLLHGVWTALALLLGLGAVLRLAFTRRVGETVTATVEGVVASVVTLAAAGTIGPGIDSASATLFLFPALLALVDGRRLERGFLLALAAAALTLLFVQLPPVTRLGTALAAGLIALALVRTLTRRVGGGA